MNQPDQGFDLLEQAEAALAVLDFHAALASASQAAEVARMADDRALDVAKSLRLKALSLTGLGRVDEAYASWRAAKADYEALGSIEGVAQCDAHLKR